ncbi:MAG: Gfo/Idh/MocA family oxidoreductase [Planctomycetes bacterium]|nr:Gfo/Idh/MocA family oxidoreductase [Planctomycetota bacterium]
MKRRTFLASAGALAGPVLLDGARAAPSERFRVAVIGRTGRGDYGHGIDTAWKAVPETEVVAVADDDPAGLAAAAKRLAVDRTFADWRAMLEAVRPDIVAIGPRWIDQHAEMALAAAERGMHVYMEKPFCRTPAEADRILAACEKGGARLAIAHPTRYSPKTETVRRLIAEGAVGTVLEWRLRGKEDRRGGGEDLWVLGSHVLDLLHRLAGRPAWCVARVAEGGEPVAARHVREGGEGLGPIAGDAIDAMYAMPDGSAAYFGSHKDAGGKPPRYGLRLFTSRGIIDMIEGSMARVLFLPDPSWSPGRTGAAWQEVSSAGIGLAEPLQDPAYGHRHTLAIRDLLDAIRTGREPIGGPTSGRDVVEMIAAVFESHRLGGRARLPLENRRNALTLLG